MRKKLLIGLGVVIVCLAGLGTVMTNPFKVTDPSDPRFDPANFQFSDYWGSAELYEALEAVLKPGMSMETVDSMLVDSGGAIKYFNDPPEGEPFYKYHYKRWYHPLIALLSMSPDPSDGVSVNIRYDEKKSLKNFKLR